MIVTRGDDTSAGSLADVTFAPPPQPVPPYGSAPGAPVPPAPRGPRRAPRGATALVVIGALLLVAALVAAVVAVTLFVRAVPFGVVDVAGGPGSAALASGPVPGSAELDVSDGTTYAVWAVDGGALGARDVAVACGGSDAPAVSAPSVSGSSSAGGVTAETVAEFTAAADTTCTVSVASAPGTSTFVVTEGWRFGEFFGTVGGTVAAALVAGGGGVLGVGLLAGGIVWRVVARR